MSRQQRLAWVVRCLQILLQVVMGVLCWTCRDVCCQAAGARESCRCPWRLQSILADSKDLSASYRKLVFVLQLYSAGDVLLVKSFGVSQLSAVKKLPGS